MQLGAASIRTNSSLGNQRAHVHGRRLKHQDVCTGTVRCTLPTAMLVRSRAVRTLILCMTVRARVVNRDEQQCDVGLRLGSGWKYVSEEGEFTCTVVNG